MFIISGEKGTGKTKLLLETAKANNGIVICKDPESMRDRAHRYGITGLDIVGYGDAYLAGKPVYTATLVKYAELICEKPCGQGVLTGIDV